MILKDFSEHMWPIWLPTAAPSVGFSSTLEGLPKDFGVCEISLSPPLGRVKSAQVLLLLMEAF